MAGTEVHRCSREKPITLEHSMAFVSIFYKEGGLPQLSSKLVKWRLVDIRLHIVSSQPIMSYCQGSGCPVVKPFRSSVCGHVRPYVYDSYWKSKQGGSYIHQYSWLGWLYPNIFYNQHLEIYIGFYSWLPKQLIFCTNICIPL